MITPHQQLLSEIEAFLEHRKMAETTFGRLAVNDGKFVGRVRSGANMTLATVAKARDFMAGAALERKRGDVGVTIAGARPTVDTRAA